MRYLIQSPHTIVRSLFLAVLFLILSGCGGGGATSTGIMPINGINGVAATGAPIVGVVTLKDSSNPVITRTTATASDGSYILDTAGLTAPFIINVVNGANSYFAIANSGIGTYNVNPITTAVVSVAAGGADLNALYANWATPASAGASAAAAANLQAADAAMQTALAPILTQFGVTGSLISSPYVANHTGADALLDVVSFTVAPGAITLNNKVTPSVILNAVPTAIIANPAATAASITVANIPAVPVQSNGATLYAANCVGCHGDIQNSTIIGRSTVLRIMGAIAADFGGMSVMSALSPQDIQAISDAIPLTPATPVVPGTLTGDVLYAQNCAACHGPLATSAKKGISIVRLQNAVSLNTGNMGRFATMSQVDMQAIVSALNSFPVTPPPPPGVPIDGAATYAANCAGCHGPLATSTKRGLTLARFIAATTTNSATTGMGYLAGLTTAEVQALIAVLPAPAAGPVTPGAPPGQALYEANCASCHGPFATSLKAGATTLRINAAIAANTGGMGVFSTLTPTQIADIATALGTVVVAPPVPGTPVGQTLYGTYCSGCHNPYATSTKAGPTMTLARIQAGITANPAQMGGFATTLTVADLTNIATELAKLPAPLLDGPGLYAANCASCHGPLATSTKGGATAAKITQEIANKRGALMVGGVATGGMGAPNLAALTPADIALIAGALAPIAPPACGSCHSTNLAGTAAAAVTGKTHATHATKPKAPLLPLLLGTAGVAGSNSCAVCHGTGYTATAANVWALPLTHNDGIKTVAVNTVGVAAANPAMLDAAIKWIKPVLSATGTVTTKGSCAPACHTPVGALRTW